MKAEVIIVGGGLAGLSAAIYLGRAMRDALVIDNGKSMARWEPKVENYLGFPRGIAGEKLISYGRRQARNYRIRFASDTITAANKIRHGEIKLVGKHHEYNCRRLLLATGIFHKPPDIPGITACLGHSMFFCKDCDGYRVQGKALAVYGWTNETAEYALGMLLYTNRVAIVTDTRRPRWSARYARLLRHYKIPIFRECIVKGTHRRKELTGLRFNDSQTLPIQALFTTRGDIYLNKIAKALGAEVDAEGQIKVDSCMETRVRGVYAAGCVTPANCQMIIAAGQGAVAAQAINRDLFLESLQTHSLQRPAVRHRSNTHSLGRQRT